MTELERAHKAFVAANDALNLVLRERSIEEREAQMVVWARFSERVKAANEAVMAATKAFDDAKVAVASHPWTGRKVWRTERKGEGYIRELVKVYGVVELRDGGTKFAANVPSWQEPKMGEAFVRYLKKDGKPGIRFSSYLTNWKLVEEG
jgi:hypothetical protein